MAIHVSRATASPATASARMSATVLEFRCLYTHDIFKKHKKWHDGSLKFHTFNRRIMVYDDTKNYIGDLHYRGDEEVAEGVELQLDRGVKVEIGEPLGQTQTDLAPLLEKGHSTNHAVSGSVPDASTRVVRRANTTIGEGRPKSLTELLGTSQGRTGRGRVSMYSPFEQRQVQADVLYPEPPTKRQKVATGKENTAVVSNQYKDNAANTVYQRTSHIQSRSQNATRTVFAPLQLATNSINESPLAEIFNVSSDEDAFPVVNSSKTPSSKSKVAEKSVADARVERRAGLSATSTPAQVPKSAAPRAQKQAKPQTLSKRVAQEASPKETIVTKAAARRGPHMASPARHHIQIAFKPGMAALRMAQHEPRRKLMYRAVPEIDDSARNGQKFTRSRGEMPPKTKSRGSDHQSTAIEPISKPAATVFDLDEYEEPMLNEDEHSQSDDNIDPCEEAAQAHSPLFFSQRSSQMAPPSPIPAECSSIEFISTQPPCLKVPECLNSIESLTSNVIEHKSSPSCPQQAIEHIWEADGGVAVQALSSAAISEKVDTPAPDTNTPRPPMLDGSLDQRSVAKEATFVSPGMSPPASSESSIQASPSHKTTSDEATVVHTILLSDEETRNQRSSPPSLNTNSVAVAEPVRDATTTIAVGPVSETMNPEFYVSDEGPWSRLEAFLLFDTWPATKEKAKPSFRKPIASFKGGHATGTDSTNVYDEVDIESDIDLSMSTARTTTPARKAMSKHLPGIRSARSVLRDEVSTSRIQPKPGDRDT